MSIITNEDKTELWQGIPEGIIVNIIV